MMAFALDLARRIGALSYDDLPPAAVHWAKVGILDTIGVTLAGSDDPSATLVAGVLSGSGPSLLLGTNKRTGPLDAALVNGTASHALDFDDCNNTLGGHPSAPILPALFALADEIGASGRDFITAYVAGFETETKISLGVNFYQYTRGWHPTSTIGVFGAAAACAKLLKLEDERIAVALAIAASLASGVKSNFGTYVKPLHVGHCARSGLFAALLARDDYTASPVAFEHKQGYFEVFNGAGNYDAAKIIPAWGQPFDIVQPGIAIKQYPCCGSTHPAIDAMLELVRSHDLKADAVERIESWTHSRRLEHTNRPDPQSTKDAKFSVQYCLARALVDRKVAIEHFEGEAYRDPIVRGVMSRVRVAPYTVDQFPAENHYGAEVKVTLRGGSVLARKVDQPAGRTSANPLSSARLKDKFDNCANRALAPARSAAVYDAIMQFERLVDVRAINNAMVADATARKPSDAALAGA
jgi:2-methylcitrate dehydratase PrpD